MISYLMSKKETLLNKFLELPLKSDLTYMDLEVLLLSLGYKKIEGNGSRVKFLKGSTPIIIHKPHPDNRLKKYVVKQLQEILGEYK